MTVNQRATVNEAASPVDPDTNDDRLASGRVTLLALLAVCATAVPVTALAQTAAGAPAPPVTDTAPAAPPSTLFVQRDQLQTAIVKRDAKRVAAFIRSGMDLNFNFNDLAPRQRTGESPLTMAINREHLEIARLLLEAKADPNRNDDFGRRPIHCAKSAEAVRLLAQFGADPNGLDATGRSAIVNAVEHGDVRALDMLLANGARLDAPIKGSDLFARAIEWRHPDLIPVLLEHGANPSSPPTQALWLLIENGDTERALLLIRSGADVDARNDRDWLLTRALFRQRWEIAEALIDAGAKVQLPDTPGCGRQFRDCPSIQLARFATFNPPTLAKLKAKGLDLDASGPDGHTALTSIIVERPMAIRAVAAGTAAAVAQNATTGEAVVKSTQPSAPTREIPAADNPARVKTLLAAGANPNKKYQTLTPLMLAVALQDKPMGMTDALIARGARIEFDEIIPKPSAETALADRAGTPHPGPLPQGERGRSTPDRNDALPLAEIAGNRQGELTGMRVGPLTWAVLCRRPDVALQLLERDRKITSADRDLLYFAAFAGYWDLVIGALPHTKEVDAANRADVTPLMLAADAGHIDAVRALLAAGAKVNARSARHWPPLLEQKPLEDFPAALAGHSPSKPKLVGGYTALRVAQEKGHTEVAHLLVAAGGKE